MALIQTITVFNPDGQNLESRQTISDIQDQFIQLLRHYLESEVSFMHSQLFFSNILQKISELKGLGEDHARILLQINSNKIEPLMLEILNLQWLNSIRDWRPQRNALYMLHSYFKMKIWQLLNFMYRKKYPLYLNYTGNAVTVTTSLGTAYVLWITITLHRWYSRAPLPSLQSWIPGLFTKHLISSVLFFFTFLFFWQGDKMEVLLTNVLLSKHSPSSWLRHSNKVFEF